MIDRRLFVVGGLTALTGLAGCGRAEAKVVILRNTGCGCCLDWVERIKVLGLEQEVRELDDRSELWRKHGMPADLAGCHSALIGPYLFEGHVPPSDIARLLDERPSGVNGLAVPGMPHGSPGMEQEGLREPYEVIAFGLSGRTLYARYR
jgi:hypothetical protein